MLRQFGKVRFQRRPSGGNKDLKESSTSRRSARCTAPTAAPSTPASAARASATTRPSSPWPADASTAVGHPAQPTAIPAPLQGSLTNPLGCHLLNDAQQLPAGLGQLMDLGADGLGRRYSYSHGAWVLLRELAAPEGTYARRTFTPGDLTLPPSEARARSMPRVPPGPSQQDFATADAAEPAEGTANRGSAASPERALNDIHRSPQRLAHRQPHTRFPRVTVGVGCRGLGAAGDCWAAAHLTG